MSDRIFKVSSKRLSAAGMTFFRRTAEFRRFFLISYSLPNLCFYTIIRSLIILKVLIRQISECLLKPKLIIIINLLMLAKLLDFLAINHSLFERRGIFIPWLLKLSHVLDTLQLAWACTFLHLSWIM